MSFCQDVKSELSRIDNDRYDAVAQAYGLLLFGRRFGLSEISLLTENVGVMNAYRDACVLLCGKEPGVERTGRGKYSLRVETREDRVSILSALGYSATISKRINFDIFDSKPASGDDDRYGVFPAFIRGAFMSSGIMSDPSKSYHMEFVAPTSRIRADFIKLFDEFEDISPKTIERNNQYVVYIKKSSQIEDLLTIMGAQSSSVRLMEMKVDREMSNNGNRHANFRAANIDKAITAAAIQAEAVEVIERSMTLDSLPESLRETAQLRKKYPTMSLSQIGRMLSVPVSKSGLSHRMKKIILLAEELKGNG